MLKISVIMPVFNAESFLDRAMESIVNQTLTDFEVICINDGSQDASGKILQAWQARDKRIQVYTQTNRGAGNARNNGLKHARGEYLLFLDSDDIFHPEMFRRMYDKCSKDKLDVVICRSDKFEMGMENVRLPMPYALQEKLLPTKQPFRAVDVMRDFFNAFVWWPWDKMFRREFVSSKGLKYQELRTSNDMYFVIAAMLLAEKIAYLDEVLVSHQIRNSLSLEGSRNKSSKCFYEALLKVQKFLLTRGMYRRFQQDFINYCLSVSLWQMDTMKGEAHNEILSFMVQEGWSNLGVDMFGEEYFYDRGKYENFCRKAGRDTKKKSPSWLIYGIGAHFSDMLEWHPDLTRLVTRVFDKDKRKIGLTLYSPRVTIESQRELRELPAGTEIVISAIKYFSEIEHEIHQLNPGLICKHIDQVYKEYTDSKKSVSQVTQSKKSPQHIASKLTRPTVKASSNVSMEAADVGTSKLLGMLIAASRRRRAFYLSGKFSLHTWGDCLARLSGDDAIFVSDSKAQYGGLQAGIPVCAPDALSELDERPFIFVFADNYEKVKKQLVLQGFIETVDFINAVPLSIGG